MRFLCHKKKDVTHLSRGSKMRYISRNLFHLKLRPPKGGRIERNGKCMINFVHPRGGLHWTRYSIHFIVRFSFQTQPVVGYAGKRVFSFPFGCEHVLMSFFLAKGKQKRNTTGGSKRNQSFQGFQQQFNIRGERTQVKKKTLIRRKTRKKRKLYVVKRWCCEQQTAGHKKKRTGCKMGARCCFWAEGASWHPICASTRPQQFLASCLHRLWDGYGFACHNRLYAYDT